MNSKLALAYIVRSWQRSREGEKGPWVGVGKEEEMEEEGKREEMLNIRVTGRVHGISKALSVSLGIQRAPYSQL